VSSVLYQLVDSSTGQLTTIGMSSDPLNTFAFTWTPVDVESLVRGTPFDAAGNPIVISDGAGGNLATGLSSVVFAAPIFPVPEPAPVLLFVTGLAVLVGISRSRLAKTERIKQLMRSTAPGSL
jgi:hypothetical protein